MKNPVMQRLWRAFDRSEEGTAMTEFVITLPIFVMIFSFMAAMQDYHIQLNRIRMRAATSMWEAAMEVQNDGTGSLFGNHSVPPLAAGDATAIINGTSSYAGDVQQTGIVTGMGSSRTGNEMRAGAGMVGVNVSDPANVTSRTFARGIAEDGLQPLQSASGPVSLFNFAVMRTAGPNTRHAGIIGTRYGMVEGTNSATIDTKVWGYSRTFAAQYDVLVSPVSVPSNEEMFVVGASRLLAEEDPCLNSLLSISYSLHDC